MAKNYFRKRLGKKGAFLKGLEKDSASISSSSLACPNILVIKKIKKLIVSLMVQINKEINAK
jgi:hypothetical protein